MMTEVHTRAIQPFGAPQVNAQAAAAKIVPEDSEMVLRQLFTAGMSNAIAEAPNAWRRYVTDTELLALNFTTEPLEFTPAAGIGEVLSRLALEPEPGEFEQGGVQTIVIGATAAARDATGRFRLQAGYIGGRLPEFQVNVRPGTAWLPEFQLVSAQPMTAYRLARSRAHESREVALADIRGRLDKARAAYAQRSPRDVATELNAELGVGQLLTARAVGVTPTAVRKWRRGDPARPEHRDRLSQLAALCRLLMEVGLYDPAGWIDIPISSESTLTPLDLFAVKRADLVVLLASGLSDPRETLDAFDPSWRSNFAPDRDYEVVTLADGSRSVVPRREASG